MNIETVTDPGAAQAIAEVAAVTFPLACPPHSSQADMAAHIANHLSAERFATHIRDDASQVLAARAEGAVTGYSLLVYTAPTDRAVIDAIESTRDGAAALAADTTAEVSKMYVLPDHHAAQSATPPARALMDASLNAARARGATYAWLGVNALNERAKKFYRKTGFVKIGERTFDMNGAVEHDDVMGRPL